MEHIDILRICELLTGSRLELGRGDNSAGQHKTAAAFCSLAVVLHVPHVKGVGSIGRRAHGGHNDAIFQCHAADLDWLKQLVHKNSSNEMFRVSGFLLHAMVAFFCLRV